MGKNYDNWGRLVEAVTRRELYRKLSLESSRSPSTSSFNSDYSSSSSYRQADAHFTPSPSTLHTDALRLKLAQVTSDGKLTKTRNLWKGFSTFSYIYPKDYGKEEREPKWANGKRTFHGHESMKSYSFKTNSRIAEEAKRKAEIKRLQEPHTHKGHFEALVEAKGLDDSATEGTSVGSCKASTKTKNVSGGQFVFGGSSFKIECAKVVRKLKWANCRRTLHVLESVRAKSSADRQRLRELLHTEGSE